MAQKAFFGFLKKEETEEEKKKKEEEEKQKELENNPLIQGKSLDPKHGEKRHSIIIESMGAGLEKHYFWVLRFLQEKPNHGLGFDKVEKVRDLFDASVTSSFHGHVGQKLSAIQTQVSQYMGTIAGMIKTIFPIVRELRVMDERLEYYTKSLEGDESAEISLKSIWIEMVEQGIQNPNSVYSLGTKVGFITVPDLFFKITVKKKEEIDAAMKSLNKEGTNKKVTDVLAKKLYQYYNWKEKTYTEMQHTRKFKIKYLRQHYASIKMYMNWVRPYLRSIKKLQMDGPVDDADLVGAFETSKINLELLAYNTKGEKYLPVLLVKFIHTTKPELQWTPQGQKQPVHSGRTEMIIEPYVATQVQIDAYKKHKDEEDMELLATLNDAMDSMKDDLKHYLAEYGEEFAEDADKKDEKKKQPENVGPFKALYHGFGDMFQLAKVKGKKKGKVDKKKAIKQAGEKKAAEGTAKALAYVLYDIFKKSNRFYSPVV